MKKKKDKDVVSLEDRFIGALKKRSLKPSPKLFNLGNKLYLPDFVFNQLIVEVEDCIQSNRIGIIKEFKKCFPHYTLVLLTNGTKECLDVAKVFDSVVDFNSIDLLLSEICKHLSQG